MKHFYMFLKDLHICLIEQDLFSEVYTSAILETRVTEDVTTQHSDITTHKHIEHATSAAHDKTGHQGNGFFVGEFIDATSQTNTKQAFMCRCVRLLNYKSEEPLHQPTPKHHSSPISVNSLSAIFLPWSVCPKL